MTEIITGATATVTIVVRDSSDATLAKTNPTIDANNDFLIGTGSGWETLDNAPTVSPAGSEFITITIADHVTQQLAAKEYRYDVKFYYGSSASTVATEATCNVLATPTETV